MYQPNEKVAVYASHSEYFASGRVVSPQRYNGGDILPPAKAKQNEIGVKFQENGWLTSLSYFDIKQRTNVDVQRFINGANRMITLQEGIDRHKGLEWNFNGRLSNKWSAFGGFMYLDAKKESTSQGRQDGWRVSAQPKWSGVVGLEYSPNTSTSFVGRMTYFGDSIVRTAAPTAAGLRVPSYTVFDVGARYKTKLWEHPTVLSLMVYNVFNRDYWMTSRGDQVYVSSPRTLTFSAQFDF